MDEGYTDLVRPPAVLAVAPDPPLIGVSTARRESLALSYRLPAKAQVFTDLLVVPQSGSRHHGGPVWPNFYRRIRARTCWGFFPIPIDTRPRCEATPRRTLEAGIWCGIVGFHYGHMIADFGMRVVYAAAFDPALPLLFALPGVPGFEPPSHFWQMIDALGIDRKRLRFVSEPLRVGLLYVFPQAERLYGGGPSAAHLDLMDRLLGDKAAIEKDIEWAFVSRSRVGRGGQIAGESYLEEVLSRLGVRIVFPEDHSVAEQIAIYGRAKRLIFSEGSAVHTLQLIGRLGADIAILVRRPRRWFGIAVLRPRVRYLRYLRAVDGLIYGLGRSRRSQKHRGVTILDEDRLLEAFRRIGLDLAPHWESPAYRARRDSDVRAWTAHRKTEPRPLDEKAFVDGQLASLGLDMRY